MYRIGIYLTLKPYIGGSYQYWYSVIKALASFDRDECYVCGLYYDDSWKKVLDSSGIDGIQLHYAPKGLVYRVLERALWKWNTDRLHSLLVRKSIRATDRHRVREQRFDVIFGDSVEFARAMEAKSVIPIHDLMHRYEKEIPELVEGYEYRERMFKRETKYVDMILVDSELGKRHVIESYGEFREGIDRHIGVLPFIPPSYIYDQEADNSISMDLPDKYLFYPAQFWSHKNHIRLLEAVAKLREKSIDINLVLVGSENNNYADVVEKKTALGLDDLIKIYGYVSNEDMVYLYKNARGLIYPTLFGPTNIPPLEAFYLNCPVAASRIYAMPEQLGDAAILFDPKNVEDIMNAMYRLWTDDALCEELIRKGRIKSDEWGPNQFAARLKYILNELREDAKEYEAIH